MAAKKSLQEMSDAEFTREWTKASKALDEAKTLCREFSQEDQRRAAEERAEAALANLTDADKQALVQTMVAEGVLPKSALGKPGGN